MASALIVIDMLNRFSSEVTGVAHIDEELAEAGLRMMETNMHATLTSSVEDALESARG